jgi:ribosome-associated protein
VRKAGFPKPRVEGEGNGEWIIVDCGQVVVHVMQPIFRSYYRLEELWGEKPVRLKLGAEKPGLVKAEVLDAAPKSEAKPKASAKVVLTPSLRRSSAAKAGVAEAFPSKAALKKAAAKKAPAPKTLAKKAPAAKARAAPAAPARSAKVPTMVVNAPVKKVARKAVPKAAPKSQAKAAPARKVLAVKAPVRKPAATKTTPRKA